ncbi:MAG: peptide ABC transporter substrate-binding protein [Vulcanimicrobiaceae bacterium]
MTLVRIVRLLRALALGCAIATSAACTKTSTNGATADGRHQYTRPHELRFAVATDIQGLNPLTHASGYEMYLAQLCMAYLIKTDAHGDATVPELITEIPSLANGGIGKDGKTITWHIRHGVTWSDGAPFDADDVVFTTNQVNNPANNVPSRDGWDQITKIDEPDKYTVVYHLKAPYSSFAVTFFSTGGANPAVLPHHLLRGLSNLNDVPYNALPVGVGPFKYRAWKRGDSVEMVRNERYFRGAPKLERVTFKIIPDRNTTLAQLRTHELDLWLPVSPHFFPQATAIPGIKGSSAPSYFFDHLDFNLTHPVLREPAVRRALRFAVDRKTIVEKVQNGLYDLGESPVTPASAFHDDLPLIPFDLARANALLDGAGWRRGSDGVRAKDGMRLSLTFASSTGSPDTDTEIEIIRSAWKQIGVEFNVKRYSSSSLFAPAAEGGIIYGGKFDVVAFAWGADPNEDLSNLYACYRFPPNGQNDPRWCDRSATAAMDRAKTSYDRATRAAAIKLVQEAVYAAVPTVILDTRKELEAYSDDLKNWHPNPVSPFDDMLAVDI